MVLIGRKSFLSIEDIGKYLNNHGENYDLYKNDDRKHLYTTIADFIFENKLTPLFFYDGYIKAEFQKSEIVDYETGDSITTDIKIFTTQNEYLKITSLQVIKELLINPHGSEWVEVTHHCGFYTKPTGYDDYFYYFIELGKDLCISIDDLRFPRSDLDAIVNKPNTQKLINEQQVTIDSQAKKIIDLENELNALKASEPNTLTVIGEYTTPAMQAMNAVINEFWTDYTPDKIPPKQENVINWIMENYGFSRNLSLAIEQVARPESAKTGGNKAV